jgi:DNA repair exonuclease SbcCD ATPase subunit
MCTQDPALLLTNRLAEEQGWKTCAQCNAIVEHKEACRHMTCRCGYQFCYVCGAKWCTCHCTGDMLSKVKVDAEARRREREEQEAKEAAEAEELREILAQIEEFEREEALKAEMLRQEQLRLEEERLQRELVEQVRRESRRRVELEQKFEQLRKDLDLLHELQQVMLVEQHEKDAKTLAQEAHQARRRLEDKQTQERADLETFIEVQMAEKELFFHKEFTARSALEKKLVEEYQSQLEAYWRNKATAAQEIDKAMGPLRDRMAKWYQAWLGWRDAELRAQREKLERQRLVKEELMYSVKARQKDQYEGRETELVKRGVAEQKWMQMVILEREKMLVEMEVGEMEGDADSLFLGGNETGGGGVGAS